MRRGSFVSRFLAIALLVGVLAITVRLLVLPLMYMYEGATESNQKSRALLVRYRMLSAQQQQLRARIALEEEAAASDVVYLTASNAALAGAALQNQVRAIVARVGGQLQSIQTYPVTAAASGSEVGRVSLGVQLLIGIDGLRKTLYELETAQPYLILDAFRVVQHHLQEQPQQTLLQASFDVIGYMAPPKAMDDVIGLSERRGF